MTQSGMNGSRKQTAKIRPRPIYSIAFSAVPSDLGQVEVRSVVDCKLMV